MARNRVGIKGSNRKRRDQDSDESDEEYKVTDDEDFDESDESYSLDGDESEEILDDFGKAKRVSRSRNTRRRSSSKKVNRSMKPRKRRRVSYTEDDNDDDEVADEDDDEFMSLDREASQVNKRMEKKRVSYTEVDDDDRDGDGGRNDDDEEYNESVFSGINRKQRTNSREKKRVVYTENDDDDKAEVAEEDDAEMSFDRDATQVNRPIEKKRVSYTEVDGDDDGGGCEDYKECVFSGRNKKQRKKPWENKRVVYTDEDDDEEVDAADEDDAEFMYMGTKANETKTSTQMKRDSYPDDDEEEEEEEEEKEDDDDYADFVSSGRKRDQRKKPQDKRVRYTEDEEEDEDEDDDEEEDDDDALGFMSTSKKRNQMNKRRDRRMVSYKEDNQEEDDESDAEFKLSESDFVDDEDETQKMKIKKNKVIRSHPQKKNVLGGRKKSKNTKIKNPTKPKQRNHRFGQKPATSKTQMEKKNKISKRQKQREMAESDSDFVSSASSDHEYTISEEEREQMREARVYCANLRAKLRSSSCGNQEKQLAAYEQKKYPIRKGKEKIEDMKDVGKQVCGICLSEEQKRTMRGVLDCCRHYFCCSCIMEWSKVESRCPLCKQRFTTITKAAKSDTGFDSRTVVIPVPERDQVYEPSEEELRGYLDPYESVICTECQNGGDDALMLLCDICDSSAHTFCVGLGREVPEGNWYCEGCRPTVFGTLNSQHLTPNSDRRLNNNTSDLPSPSPIAGGFDLNELYVPETPLTQQTRVHPEPNPAPTGTAATTLRDRRRIRRQIHHRLLNNNRMNDLVGRSSGTSASSSGIRLFGSQLDQARVSVPQSEHIFPSMHDSSNFYPRTDQFSEQVQNLNFASSGVALQDEHVSNLGSSPLLPCTNRSSIREAIGPSGPWQGSVRAPN